MLPSSIKLYYYNSCVLLLSALHNLKNSIFCKKLLCDGLQRDILNQQEANKNFSSNPKNIFLYKFHQISQNPQCHLYKQFHLLPIQQTLLSIWNTNASKSHLLQCILQSIYICPYDGIHTFSLLYVVIVLTYLFYVCKHYKKNIYLKYAQKLINVSHKNCNIT